MESLQRGEEEEHMLPLHKYDNTDDILKGDEEIKCVSQTLALLFLLEKLLVKIMIKSFCGAENWMTQQLGV